MALRDRGRPARFVTMVIVLALAIVAAIGGARRLLDPAATERRADRSRSTSTATKADASRAAPLPAVVRESVSLAPKAESLRNEGTLDFIVRRCTGEPIEGAVVSLIHGLDAAGAAVQSDGRSGADGRVAVPGGEREGEWLRIAHPDFREERRSLSSLSRDDSGARLVELHPARRCRVVVRSGWGAAIEGATVSSRVFRERPIESFSASINAVAAGSLPRHGTTGPGGSIVIASCDCEQTYVDVAAFGYRSSSFEIPAAAAVANGTATDFTVEATLDALLIAAARCPTDELGNALPGASLSLVRVDVRDPGTYRPIPASDSRPVEDRLRELLGDGLLVALDVEGEPALYPPTLDYRFVAAPGVAPQEGQVRLRRFSDVERGDVIESPASHQPPPVGTLEVELPDGAPIDSVTNLSWGVRSLDRAKDRGIPAAALPPSARPTEGAVPPVYRFTLAPGRYEVAPLRAARELAQFDPMVVEVATAKVTKVAVSRFQIVPRARVTFVGVLPDGSEAVDLSFFAFREVPAAELGKRRRSPGLLVRTRELGADGLELAYGDYVVEGGSADQTWRFDRTVCTVDQPTLEVRLALRAATEEELAQAREDAKEK